MDKSNFIVFNPSLQNKNMTVSNEKLPQKNNEDFTKVLNEAVKTKELPNRPQTDKLSSDSKNTIKNKIEEKEDKPSDADENKKPEDIVDQINFISAMLNQIICSILTEDDGNIKDITGNTEDAKNDSLNGAINELANTINLVKDNILNSNDVKFKQEIVELTEKIQSFVSILEESQKDIFSGENKNFTDAAIMDEYKELSDAIMNALNEVQPKDLEFEKLDNGFKQLEFAAPNEASKGKTAIDNDSEKVVIDNDSELENHMPTKDSEPKLDDSTDKKDNDLNNDTSSNTEHKTINVESFLVDKGKIPIVKGLNAKTNITPEVNKDSIVDQVIEQAKLLLKDDKSEIKIKLKPEILGDLFLKIEVENGVVAAKAVVDNYKTKEIIESNFTQLRESLKEQGFDIKAFEVFVGSNGDFEREKNGSPFNQNKKKKSSLKLINHVDPNIYEKSINANEQLIKGDTSIDLFA